MDGESLVAASHKLHPSLVNAIVSSAESNARFVGECLHALRDRLKEAGHRDGAQGLPPAFLLELGAIGQLILWERARLRDFLPSDLPTAAEATTEICRATEVPHDFQSVTSARLLPRVTQVHVEHIS